MFAIPTDLTNTLVSTQTLTTLPVEVLSIVFGQLHWKDVLNLRKTCRLMQCVSQTREVWLRQYLRLSDSYEFALPLHDHVESMSSQELESATLLWERIETQWMSKASPPRRRSFKCPDGESTIFHLVRGGRWLLVSGKGGSMLAYDLDIPDGRPRTIIEYGLNTENGGLIASYYPNSHPLSSLLVAIIYYDSRGFYSGCSIWEVGNLQGNCPITTFLHSLKFTSLEGGPPFCLTGNYLAWSGLSCIEIYDWKRSSPLCHYKTGFQVAGFPRRIELLPDGRILSFYHDSLAIYALPEFRIIKDEGWVHQSTIQPLRSLRFPDQAYLVSPSYSPLRIERDGTCVMLIRPYKSMYKLTIPPVTQSHLHVDSEVTLTFICSDFNRHLNSATFGFYRNLAEPAYKEVRRYTLLRGSVKDCHEPHALGSKDYNISDVQYLYPVLDDISCRSVLAMARQDRFEVLDYAPSS